MPRARRRVRPLLAARPRLPHREDHLRGGPQQRGRLPLHDARFEAEALQANLKLADRVREIAERKGALPGQVAIAWTLAQGEHVVPIPGTKRLRYLEENAAAADVVLDAQDLADLDALPPAVGGRYR